MPDTIDQRRSTTSRIRTRKAAVKPPAYRQREGYDQAIVTLSDARSGAYAPGVQGGRIRPEQLE